MLFFFKQEIVLQMFDTSAYVTLNVPIDKVSVSTDIRVHTCGFCTVERN